MRRLLVVDDHAPSRRLACMIMAPQGWQCDEAASGREALAMIAANRYDCVLLDISMPEMSGEEVCLAIRQDPSLAGRRVVAFTEHAMAHERARIMAIGFDEIVTKSTTIAVLTTAIEGAGASR
jgi:CheY-like chemotaxis protein